MKYPRFDPPANLADFTTDDQRTAWSTLVASYFSEGVKFNEGFEGVTSQFYDPVRTDTTEPHGEPVIDWPAFPKLIKDEFPNKPLEAWKKAETGPGARADFMDEYLEWHVVRNAAGKMTRVSFTCETEQYYDFLARTDRNKLLAIYKELVDPAFKTQVKIGDLIAGGEYRPRNKWNTEHGAVHLIQDNNNLYAEVMIAAQACILRKRDNGTPITTSDALIKCSRFGEAGRASDPKIGAIVNQTARGGSSISLRNPVALYITKWSSAGWKRPDGKPVGDYWKLVRGVPPPAPNKPAMGLHLVYEVPASEGFVVGDIKIGTRTIQYGGQIAESINVGLYALVCREGAADNPLFTCGSRPDDELPFVAKEAFVAAKKPALRGRKK